MSGNLSFDPTRSARSSSSFTPPYLTPEFPSTDKFLASILVSCCLVGTPANTLAFVYFVRKCKKDIASLLYTAICATDACTCICSIPIILVLCSNSREKALFEDIHFCDLWVHAFYFLTCMSIFLVMLISVSRTISIKFPFFESKKLHITISISVYLALIIFRDIILHHFSTRSWTRSAAFCAGVVTKGDDAVPIGLSNIFLVLQVAVPSVIVALSFFITLTEFWRKNRAPDEVVTVQIKQTRRATVTVTLFTALFLVCNTPFLLVLTLTIISQLFWGWEYPEPFFGSPFVFWYAYILAAVLFVVINAAINPLIYYFRMNGFSEWVSECCRRNSRRQSNSFELFKNGRRKSSLDFYNANGLKYHRQVQTEESV